MCRWTLRMFEGLGKRAEGLQNGSRDQGPSGKEFFNSSWRISECLSWPGPFVGQVCLCSCVLCV